MAEESTLLVEHAGGNSASASPQPSVAWRRCRVAAVVGACCVALLVGSRKGGLASGGGSDVAALATSGAGSATAAPAAAVTVAEESTRHSTNSSHSSHSSQSSTRHSANSSAHSDAELVTIDSIDCGTQLMKLTCDVQILAHRSVTEDGGTTASVCYRQTSSDRAEQICVPLIALRSSTTPQRIYRLRAATEYELIVRVNYGPGLRGREVVTMDFTSASTGLDAFDGVQLATFNAGTFSYEVRSVIRYIL